MVTKAAPRYAASRIHTYLLQPAFAHLNGLLPPAKLLRALFCRDFWRELCHPSRVDVLQLIEGLPYSNCKPCSDRSAKRCSLKHGWALHRNAYEVRLGLLMSGIGTSMLWKRETYLHAKIRVRHPTVDCQLGKCLPAVLLHGVENRLCLETGGFEGCSCDMPLLSVRRDTDWFPGQLQILFGPWLLTDCAARIINPVWCEEPTEGCDKHATSVVVHSFCKLTDFVGSFDKAEVVLQKLDT